MQKGIPTAILVAGSIAVGGWLGATNYRQQESLDGVSPANVCRAAIAVLMAQPVGIIRADRVEGAVPFVSYHRPSDGTLWSNKCKLEGSRIIWASADGRWRDIPGADEVLTFQIDRGTRALTIRQQFPDGSGTTDTFAPSDFN